MGLLRGRHDASAKILQSRGPKFAFLEGFFGSFEFIESDFALFHPIPMAIVTILLEKRLDFLLKLSCARGDSGRLACARKNGSERHEKGANNTSKSLYTKRGHSGCYNSIIPAFGHEMRPK